MCLERANVVTLDEDKVVYKVFIKKNDGTLLSLYQGKIYKLSDEPIHDDLYDGQDEIDENRIHINGHTAYGHKMNDGYEVYGGMIHSFKNYEDAVNEAILKYNLCYNGYNVVVKCIIPKNSQLVMLGEYECIYGFISQSYASSDIIFKEIVYVV